MYQVEKSFCEFPSLVSKELLFSPSRNLQKHLPHFFLLLSAQTRVNVKEAFKLEAHLISSQRPKIPRMLQRTVTSTHKPLVHSTERMPEDLRSEAGLTFKSKFRRKWED